MTGRLGFIAVLDFLAKATMVAAAFCAFGLAFLILTDVLARNTGFTFVGVPEYVRNTLIVIIFLQLPYAVRLRSMLVVDIFVGALPNRARLPLSIFGAALGLAFFGLLAYGAFEPAVNAWVKGEVEGEGEGSTDGSRGNCLPRLARAVLALALAFALQFTACSFPTIELKWPSTKQAKR